MLMRESEANAGHAGRFRETQNDALRGRCRERLEARRTSLGTLAPLERLFVEPAVTAASVARALNVSPTTAQDAIDRYVEAGILREITGRRRGRVYLAQEILDGDAS